MGFAISWLAVRGKDPATIVAALGLTATGTKAEYAEDMYTGRLLPTNWFLLVINQCDHKFVTPKILSTLSGSSEVLACSVEEHVMVSTAELWRDGAQIWRIEHNAQDSIDHLQASGALPQNFEGISSALTEQQVKAGGSEADVDYYFDIPLQTAKSIVGFKHDEASGLEDSSFDVFHLSSNAPKAWWKLWK